MVRNMPNRRGSAKIGPAALVRLSAAYRWPLPRDSCIKARLCPTPTHLVPKFFFGSSPSLSSLKTLRKHHFSSFFAWIFIKLSNQVACSWMFLVLILMTPLSSLRGRSSMRRSSKDGGVIFLVVSRNSFDIFLETPPLSSTLHYTGT